MNVNQLEASLESIHHEDLYEALKNVPKDQLARTVDTLKSMANNFYHQGQLKDAVTKYSEALQGAVQLKDTQTAVKLLGNRSMAKLRLDDVAGAKEDATLAIRLDSSWAKGYYRLATALMVENKYPEAKPLFEKVLTLQPGNAQAQAQLAKCVSAINMLRRTFGQDEQKVTNTTDGTVKYDTRYRAKEFDTSSKVYTASPIAQGVRQLLHHFSDLHKVRELVHQSYHPQFPYQQVDLHPNTLLYGGSVGKCVGELVLNIQARVKKLAVVESYPTVRKLVQGTVTKNSLMQQQDTSHVKFVPSTDNTLDFEPKCVVFNNWDFTGLGTGWLKAKRTWKTATFYPQEMVLSIQLVSDPTNILQTSWNSCVQKAPKELVPASDLLPLPVVKQEHTTVQLEATRPDIVGVVYSYKVKIGTSWYEPVQEKAFYGLTPTCTDNTVLLTYSIRGSKIVFEDQHKQHDRVGLPSYLVSMASDSVKQNAYTEALKQISPTSIIVPHCGTGVLTKLAAEIHPDTSLVAYATHPDAVQLAQQPNLDVSLGNALEYQPLEQADLCLFDLFDAGLLGEGILHLLPKLRAQGKQLMPQAATVYAALAECRSSEVNGLNQTLCNPYRYQPSYHTVKDLDYQLVSDPVKITTFDFATMTPESKELGVSTFHPKPNKVVSAVVFWFVLDLGNGVTLQSNECPQWNAALQYLPEYETSADAAITIQCRHDASSIQFGLVPDQCQHATPIPTPRFDVMTLKKQEALEHQMSEVMGRLKWHPHERKDVFHAAQLLATSPGNFAIEPTVADRFLKNVLVASNVPKTK